MLRHATTSSHVHALLMQGVSAVFGMTTFLLMARWMGPADMGVVVLFITAITLLDMLRSGFFQPAMVRMVHESDATHAQAVRGTTLALALGISGILSLILWSGSQVALAFGMDVSPLVHTVWPILLIAGLPGQFFSWRAQADSRFDRMLGYRLVNGVIMLGGIVVLDQLDMLSVLNVGWTFVAAASIASLSVIGLGWVGLSDIRLLSVRIGGELARFGRYAMTTTLGTALLRSSDTFLIGALMDAGAVAVYGLAQKAIEALELPLRALSSSVYPILAKPGARGEGKRVGRIIERVVGGYMLVLIGPAILLALVAEPLVSLVAGSDYLTAAPVIQVFVLAALIAPLDRLIGLGLDSVGRPSVNMTKVLLMLACNVIGDIWVISVWGTLPAVAMVTFAMNSIGMLYGVWKLGDTTTLSWRRTLKASRRWMVIDYIRLQLALSSHTKSGRR